MRVGRAPLRALYCPTPPAHKHQGITHVVRQPLLLDHGGLHCLRRVRQGPGGQGHRAANCGHAHGLHMLVHPHRHAIAAQLCSAGLHGCCGVLVCLSDGGQGCKRFVF